MARIQHSISGDTATNNLQIVIQVTEEPSEINKGEFREYIRVYLHNTSSDDIVVNTSGFEYKIISDTYSGSGNLKTINTTISSNEYYLLLDITSASHTYDSDGTKYIFNQCVLIPTDNFDADTNTNITCDVNGYILLTGESQSQNEYYTEISDHDKQLLDSGSATIKTKLVITGGPNNVSMGLTEEDSVKTWKYNEERYVPNNGVIGQFVARTLSGELQNISDDFNIEDCNLKLLMGIVEPDSRYTYLATENDDIITDEESNEIITSEADSDNVTWYQLGDFLITKPSDNEVTDNTKFDAMDYTVLFNVNFDASYTSLNFTQSFNNVLARDGYVTALWLARYTCDQANVSFNSTTFTNWDYHINTNQFTGGESLRDVMKAIAQLAFGWVRIGWDNNCYIDEFEQIATQAEDYDTLDYNKYYSLTTQKNSFGPVNKIVIGMQDVEGENAFIQDETSILENGLCELQIWDNPLTYTQEQREQVIQTAQHLLGLTYKPLETETIGHPWYQANKLIKIKDMELNTISTYMFNKDINYSGHIRTPLTSVASTTQEDSVTYDSSLYKDIRDVRIQVNKQDGVITLLNSNITALDDGLSKLENRVETTYTDSYTKTEIQEIISGTNPDGTVVSSVTTTAGTFDKDGLTIEQTEADTKTNINANGMVIYDATGSVDDPLLTVNSDGVIAKNIKLSTYLTIGQHSRIEDYDDPEGGTGTGVFWIGDDF